MGLNVPLPAVQWMEGSAVAAASSKVNVTPVRAGAGSHASLISSVLRPSGPVRRTSRSSAEEALMPLSVARTPVTTPPIPLTAIADG